MGSSGDCGRLWKVFKHADRNVGLSTAAFIFSQTHLWLSLEKRKQERWLQIKVKIESFLT